MGVDGRKKRQEGEDMSRFYQIRFKAPGNADEPLDEVSLLRHALDNILDANHHTGAFHVPDLEKEQGVEVKIESSYGRGE